MLCNMTTPHSLLAFRFLNDGIIAASRDTPLVTCSHDHHWVSKRFSTVTRLNFYTH